MPVLPDVTVCASYAAGPTGAALEEALQKAVEAAESSGFLTGRPKGDGTCNHEDVPTRQDPYLTRPDPTVASKRVANIQSFSGRPLDFSNVNPEALRRGIESLQLVLRAIETNRRVVISVPDRGQ